MPVLALVDPVNGTVTDAELIANNNHSIISTVNGLTNENIDPSAAISPQKLAGFPSDGTKVLLGDGSWGIPATAPGTPTGVISQFAGAVAPAGWHLCDGFSALRTDPVYAALFAVISIAYGSADGTHFNLPDLQGRIPVGKGTNASVNALGQNDAQPVANRRPHHRTTKSGSAAVSGSNSSIGLSDGGHIHTTLVHQIDVVRPSDTGGTYGGVPILSVGPDDNGNPTKSATANVSLTGAQSSIGVSDTIVVGSNVGTDALDTPSYVVVNYIIKL